MPCLSGKFDPNIGAIINVGVIVANTFNPSSPNIEIKTFPALIDTGATLTCISPAVAEAETYEIMNHLLVTTIPTGTIFKVSQIIETIKNIATFNDGRWQLNLA